MLYFGTSSGLSLYSILSALSYYTIDCLFIISCE